MSPSTIPGGVPAPAAYVADSPVAAPDTRTGGVPPAADATLPGLDLSALIDAPAPGGRGVPEPRGSDGASLDDAGPAIDDALENLSTDIGALMALYAKLAQEMRNNAREQRQTELTAQVSALESAADEMVQAAAARFSAALTQGLAQIAGGVISIASAAATFAQLRPTRQVGANMTDFEVVKPDVAPGSLLSNKLQMQQSLATGLAQVVQGSGGLLAAGYERDAGLADSRAKQLEADGLQAQAGREAAQDAMQAMADILRDIREQARAIAQSDIEANRGIARNI